MLPAYFYYFLHVIDDHSLQSPFLFDLYGATVKKTNGQGIESIEQYRELLKRDKSPVPGIDHGAGTRVKNDGKRTIAQIAKYGLSPAKTAYLLHLLVRHFHPQNIIELGTSLGISAIYLARGNGQATVHTFEGNANIASRPEIFEKAQKNIHIVVGDIDETLPKFIEKHQEEVGLLFIDANHRKEAVQRYLKCVQPILSKNAVVVVDDIRWSPEMFEAWKELARRGDGQIYIDMLQYGLIIKNENFHKEHLCW